MTTSRDAVRFRPSWADGSSSGRKVINRNSNTTRNLVLELGNVIMGDEGIGVHVVCDLGQHPLPQNVECLEGGTEGFFLLEPLHLADRIFLIDATADENPIGTVTRTTPKFSKDYPPTLTAHDIGVKDLLDAFYMQGGNRDVILYAISIDPHQKISMDLSDACRKAADEAVARILAELHGSSESIQKNQSDCARITSP